MFLSKFSCDNTLSALSRFFVLHINIPPFPLHSSLLSLSPTADFSLIVRTKDRKKRENVCVCVCVCASTSLLVMKRELFRLSYNLIKPVILYKLGGIVDVIALFDK